MSDAVEVVKFSDGITPEQGALVDALGAVASGAIPARTSTGIASSGLTVTDAAVTVGNRTLSGLAAPVADSDAARKVDLPTGTAATKDFPAEGDASSAQVVLGSDSRLTNSRAPTVHASSHASDGTDPVFIAQSQVAGLGNALAAKITANARSIRILGIGDSHMQGFIVTTTVNAVDTLGSSALFCPKDDQWTAAGTIGIPYRDNGAINVSAGSMDPNLEFLGNQGSFLSRVPGLLRRAYLYLDRIRTAICAVGGASYYSWVAECAQARLSFASNALDGDTIQVLDASDTVLQTYTFRNSPSLAYDVQISAGGAKTSANIFGYTINGLAANPTPASPHIWAPRRDPAPADTVYCVSAYPGVAGNGLKLRSSTASRIAVLDAGGNPTTNAVPLTGGSATSALYTNTKSTLAGGSGFGSPDVIVISLGTNDSKLLACGSCPSPVDYLPLLLANLAADFPTAKVILIKPPVNNQATWNTKISTVINPAVDAAVTAEPTRVYAVDMYSLGAGSGPTSILNSLGLHLTSYGYEIEAQLAARKIAEACGLE